MRIGSTIWIVLSLENIMAPEAPIKSIAKPAKAQFFKAINDVCKIAMTPSIFTAPIIFNMVG